MKKKYFIKFNIKKIYFLLSLLLISNTALAQDKGSFEERTDLLKTYGTKNFVSVGWYVDKNETKDIREQWVGYINFSNFISRGLDKLTILETENNDREISEDALKNNMEFVFTTALMGSQLINYGYKPLVGLSDDIRAVILAPKSISFKQIKDIKILSTKNNLLTNYMKYSLIRDNIYKIESFNDNNKNFIENSNEVGQNMFNMQAKLADAVVVRDFEADKFIQRNSDYHIIYRAVYSPGHILFVNTKKVPENIQVKIKEDLKSLNDYSEVGKNILKGTDFYKQGEKFVFKYVGEDELETTKKVFSLLKLKPLKKY